MIIFKSLHFLPRIVSVSLKETTHASSYITDGFVSMRLVTPMVFWEHATFGCSWSVPPWNLLQNR